MHFFRYRMTVLGAVAAVTILAGGCATTTQAVASKAEQAQEDAAEAKAAAERAERMAEQAMSQADAAMREAQAAQKCCKDTNTRIDRMFKRSMQK